VTPEHLTFSVIIPTSGRATLSRTLRSVQRQRADDIEVIVISDGEQPAAEAIVREQASHWPELKYISGPVSGRWGHAQREEAIKHAKGAYLLFMDDDDVYHRDAFRQIRHAIRRHPDRVIIFRMKRFDRVLWQRPQIEEGQVSTVQFVVPNLPDKVGSWVTNERYASDFDFISETVELQGAPVWDTKVIVTVEPLDLTDPAPWLRLRRDHWRVKLALRTRLRRVLRRVR